MVNFEDSMVSFSDGKSNVTLSHLQSLGDHNVVIQRASFSVINTDLLVLTVMKVRGTPLAYVFKTWPLPPHLHGIGFNSVPTTLL